VTFFPDTCSEKQIGIHGHSVYTRTIPILIVCSRLGSQLSKLLFVNKDWVFQNSGTAHQTTRRYTKNKVIYTLNSRENHNCLPTVSNYKVRTVTFVCFPGVTTHCGCIFTSR
jgi:hypothetical protein